MFFNDELENKGGVETLPGTPKIEAFSLPTHGAAPGMTVGVLDEDGIAMVRNSRPMTRPNRSRPREN